MKTEVKPLREIKGANRRGVRKGRLASMKEYA